MDPWSTGKSTTIDIFTAFLSVVSRHPISIKIQQYRMISDVDVWIGRDMQGHTYGDMNVGAKACVIHDNGGSDRCIAVWWSIIHMVAMM